jgi:hypothetical protein
LDKKHLKIEMLFKAFVQASVFSGFLSCDRETSIKCLVMELKFDAGETFLVYLGSFSSSQFG